MKVAAICLLATVAGALEVTAPLPSRVAASWARAAVRLADDGDGAVKIAIKKPGSGDDNSAASTSTGSSPRVTIKVKPPSERAADGSSTASAPIEEVETTIKVNRPNAPEPKVVSTTPARSKEEELLLEATQRANVTMILEALKTGVNPNFKDPSGRTPLHFMAGVGLAPAVVLLVHFGAQVNARDDGGLTPMHMAAGYANAQTLRVLVAAGADDKLEAPSQGTPFEVVVALGEYQYKSWMEKKKKPFEKKDDKLEKLKACVDVLENAEEIREETDWDELLEDVLKICAL